LTSPSSVMWHPQQLRELHPRAGRRRQNELKSISERSKPAPGRSSGAHMSRSRRLTAAWTRRAAVSSPVRCPAKLSRSRAASDRSTARRHLQLTPPALSSPRKQRKLESEPTRIGGSIGKSSLRTWTGRGRRAGGRGRVRGGRRAAARCRPPPRRPASPPSSSLACFCGEAEGVGPCTARSRAKSPPDTRGRRVVGNLAARARHVDTVASFQKRLAASPLGMLRPTVTKSDQIKRSGSL
jgi:hypothetical protein